MRPDEIYNLAAQSDVKASFDIPEYSADVDALGTLRLLEACRIYGINKIVRFYQASTSELFGKVEQCPQSENTPFHPYSPYAIAKQYSYWIVKEYREAYGMFAVNGILFNHESERRGEEFVTRKITLAAARIMAGQQEYLELGNLNSLRDWGYTKDYVEAMWLMLQQEEPAVLEKQHDFNVISYSGEWKDLGTWDTLSEEMNIENDNVIINNCSNTHVINFLDKPAVVSGINDWIVVFAEDGILVSSKEDAKKIKQLVPHNRPFYEEKRWGEYRVIGKGDKYLVKELYLLPHKEISYQSHNYREESWTIVSGCGTVVINDEVIEVGVGDVVNIAKKQKHKIISGENGIKFIEVQIGNILEESDIIRYR